MAELTATDSGSTLPAPRPRRRQRVVNRPKRPIAPDIEIRETHRVHEHAMSPIIRASKPLATVEPAEPAVGA